MSNRWLPLLTVCFASTVSAQVDYELVVARSKTSPIGTGTTSLTINGGIPGPVLRFTEGQTARIRVVNRLTYEETSIHWHGLLLPNGEDGVPFLTTPPILPGESRVYEFELRQSGTYWYHSHTGLQEQQGVYGAIVITPEDGERVATDRDEVVVLSDWTDEDPVEVMRTLMRASEWYAIEKGNQQSIVGAYRAGMLGRYFRRQRARMPAMDISDVAYDAFLANGREKHRIGAEPGERVRLRFVNAGASTYFYLTAGEGPLTVVAADGIDVEPVEVPRLLIAIAETYDVVVQVPASGGLELQAVAQDGSGHATIVVGDGEAVVPGAPPRPDLYKLDDTVIGAMDAVRDTVDPTALERPRPPTPYNVLRAVESTKLPTDAPRREIELRLTGDMSTYRWGFDGKTFAEDPVIGIREGEVVRMVLINDTMMHHPIHVHGHFFRVLTPQGDHSPLKHTVDVPPMGRRTIEFLADEPGDWLMHCHILYHMDAGMTRVISYRAHEPDFAFDVDPKLYGQTHAMLDGSIFTHMGMARFGFMHDREMVGVRAHAEFHDSGHHDHDPELEVDLFWTHLFDENLRSVIGYRFAENDGTEDRAFGGAMYRLPFMVWVTATADSEGDFRFNVDKSFALVERVELDVGLEYDTETEEEFDVQLEYALHKRFSAALGWHSDHGVGVGFSFSF